MLLSDVMFEYFLCLTFLFVDVRNSGDDDVEVSPFRKLERINNFFMFFNFLNTIDALRCRFVKQPQIY